MVLGKRRSLENLNTDISTARRRLETAQSKLEQSQEQLAHIPINHSRPDPRRGTLYATIEHLKQEIEDAEQALVKAENDFSHERRLQKVDADRNALNEQYAQEQNEHAQRAESIAKQEAGSRFVAAGGTAEQFEKAWPDMWQQKIIQRANSAHPSTALAKIQANVRGAI